MSKRTIKYSLLFTALVWGQRDRQRNDVVPEWSDNVYGRHTPPCHREEKISCRISWADKPHRTKHRILQLIHSKFWLDDWVSFLPLDFWQKKQQLKKTAICLLAALPLLNFQQIVLRVLFVCIGDSRGFVLFPNTMLCAEAHNLSLSFSCEKRIVCACMCVLKKGHIQGQVQRQFVCWWAYMWVILQHGSACMCRKTCEGFT